MSTIYDKLLSKCPHTTRSLHNLKRYVQFIEQCQASNKSSQSKLENHHICPKAQSLFPEYTNLRVHKWNSALLTPRQHLIAHWMLARIYSGEMGSALWYMVNHPSRRVSSRMYAESRSVFASDQSVRSKAMWMNQDYRTMMTELRTDLWLDEVVRGRSTQLMKDAWTEDRRSKQRALSKDHMTNLNTDPEFVKKRNEAAGNHLKALHADPEFCAKRDKRALETMNKLNATFQECLHCKRMFKLGNYARWHGDNCKLKR